MRFIGKCPNCGTDDTVTTKLSIDAAYTTHERATCEHCGHIWRWEEIQTELNRNKYLTRIEIVLTHWWAGLYQPAGYFVQNARLIKSVANVALLVKFPGLRVSTACEGGLEGKCQDELIDIRNDPEDIQLWDDLHFPVNPVCQEIFGWYTHFLEALFVSELTHEDKSLGRCAILKIDQQKDREWQELTAKHLLFLALQEIEDAAFAKQVFERLGFESGKPSGKYLAGLTDQDVIDLYKPPPLW
jgi:hypothetical protein